MTSTTLLRLVILLGLVLKCRSIQCHFCTSPVHYQSETCPFRADCPRNSPGCLVIEVEDEIKRYVVRTCSLAGKCNETVISNRNSDDVREISCIFCDTDLCNSGPRRLDPSSLSSVSAALLVIAGLIANRKH